MFIEDLAKHLIFAKNYYVGKYFEWAMETYFVVGAKIDYNHDTGKDEVCLKYICINDRQATMYHYLSDENATKDIQYKHDPLLELLFKE